MLIDTHTHVGQFYEQYTSPRLLSEMMKEVGADYYAVSSTTMCEENYEKVLSEIQKLVEIDGKRVLPTLWITPNLILEDKEHLFLESGIKWRMLKIHPQLDPMFWQKEEECTDYVVELCRQLDVPLLIHTGEKDDCDAHNFLPIIKRHPDQIFILAHGRPIGETIAVMKECGNAWCDTAFMPVNHIAMLVSEGLTDRILWGTDVPINLHFIKDKTTAEYYMERIEELERIVNEDARRKILAENARRALGDF